MTILKLFSIQVFLLLLVSCANFEYGTHYIVTPIDGQSVTTRQQSILVSPPQDFDVDRVIFYIDSNYVGEDSSPEYTYVWNIDSRYTNGPHIINVEIESLQSTLYEPLTDKITVYVRKDN